MRQSLALLGCLALLGTVATAPAFAQNSNIGTSGNPNTARSAGDSNTYDSNTPQSAENSANDPTSRSKANYDKQVHKTGTAGNPASSGNDNPNLNAGDKGGGQAR